MTHRESHPAAVAVHGQMGDRFWTRRTVHAFHDGWPTRLPAAAATAHVQQRLHAIDVDHVLSSARLLALHFTYFERDKRRRLLVCALVLVGGHVHV